MTDKQIIIDGVDVAECQYLYFAIEDSIIDYKEYPRCSIGEAFTNNACKNSNCYYKQLKAKEQECVRLNLKIIELKAENMEFFRSINDINKKIDKYEKALQEIKEIAEKGHKERGNLMRTWWFKDILQKISEVEDV